ncbi:hypothetical protein EYC59_02535 [Candidatus Saccharibacteria bacterium]|nr:MAG: hypothetical protein EYC59_02535 [Candidatus Saccharibacteria bacterium]
MRFASNRYRLRGSGVRCAVCSAINLCLFTNIKLSIKQQTK